MTEQLSTAAAAAAKSLSRVWLCATPKTAAHQAPPSLGFSRQEHWSGLPFHMQFHLWGLHPYELITFHRLHFLIKSPEALGSNIWLCISVQFSCSVVSNSLQSHESQHARLPCPSPNFRVHSNSCPSSQWCHRAISSSVVPFSSCPQSLPASRYFPMSQLIPSGGQSIGVSALVSLLPMNTQDGPPLECTGWISLQSKRLSRAFYNTTSILRHSAFSTVQLSHPYMTTGKTIALTRQPLLAK